MFSFRTLRWLARRGISRRRLRGGFWHRVLGERLFAKSLWRMERDSIARGWIIGALAGSFPLGGVQWLLGVPTALLFRANLFVVAALICATNPLTIGFYYPFCFVVGCRVIGRPVADFHWEHWGGLTFLDAGLPLLVGTMTVGGAIGTVGYAATYLFWGRIRSGAALPSA